MKRARLGGQAAEKERTHAARKSDSSAAAAAAAAFALFCIYNEPVGLVSLIPPLRPDDNGSLKARALGAGGDACDAA